MVEILKKSILLLALITTLLVCSCESVEIVISETTDPYATLQTVYTQYGDTLFPGTSVLYSASADLLSVIDPYLANLYFGNGTEDIDITKMESYALLSAAPVTASQFGIIKAKTEADAVVVVEWIEERFIRVASDFSSYLPLEETIAKSTVIKTSGCYVWYAACSDNNSVLTAIEDALQNH